MAVVELVEMVANTQGLVEMEEEVVEASRL